MSMDREVICQLLSALLLAIARPPYVAAEIYFAADAQCSEFHCIALLVEQSGCYYGYKEA